MSVESILARARARMVDVMSDTVVVKRGDGPGTYNSTTKTQTPAAGATVYDGQALVHALSAPGEQAGETGAVVLWGYEVKLPAETAIERGDTITVTASTYDSGLTGLTVWVLEVVFDEWSKARVLRCSDQRPEVYR